MKRALPKKDKPKNRFGRSMFGIMLKDVVKTYFDGTVETSVLSGVNMEIRKGELAVIMGPSGCGKTTLLNLIAGIDTVDSGTIKVGGKDVTKLSERELTNHRKDSIGYIFQFFNLIPALTAIENVELALQIKGDKDLGKAQKALEEVGLGDKAVRFPSQLSGGEQQRVAIARALVKSPLVIIADEPTGNLDDGTSHEILELIRKMNRETGTTVVLATHDNRYREYADRIIEIRGGRIKKRSTRTETI